MSSDIPTSSPERRPTSTDRAHVPDTPDSELIPDSRFSTILTEKKSTPQTQSFTKLDHSYYKMSDQSSEDPETDTASKSNLSKEMTTSRDMGTLPPLPALPLPLLPIDWVVHQITTSIPQTPVSHHTYSTPPIFYQGESIQISLSSLDSSTTLTLTLSPQLKKLITPLQQELISYLKSKDFDIQHIQLEDADPIDYLSQNSHSDSSSQDQNPEHEEDPQDHHLDTPELNLAQSEYDAQTPPTSNFTEIRQTPDLLL